MANYANSPPHSPPYQQLGLIDLTGDSPPASPAPSNGSSADSPPHSPAYAYGGEPEYVPDSPGAHPPPEYHPIGPGYSPTSPWNRDASAAGQENTGAYKCVACWINPPSMLMTPCMHLSLCDGCLPKSNWEINGCPMCRAFVDRVMGPVFLP